MDDIPNLFDDDITKEEVIDLTSPDIIENELIDMPNEEYHSKREYISASQIKDLLKNPYSFFNPQPHEDKYVFAIGSMIHMLLLEPENFEKEFVVAPKCDKRTAIGKKDWLDFNESNKDKTIIASQDFDNCIALQKSVLAVPDVAKLLDGGVSEKSYFTTGEDGIKRKVRPDRFKINSKGKRIGIDIKSCIDASPDAFKKDIAKWGYHIQDAHYTDTLNLDMFIYIAVEKKPPYMVGIYVGTEEDRDLGRDLIKKALLISKQPEKYKYPMYNVNSELVSLTLPSWVHYQNENN